MNDTEIHEIKKTWEIPMANPIESGSAILVSYFTKYPSNMDKFTAFQGIPLDELKENARFKSHAGRIMRVFDDSIQSLGYDWSGSKLEELWGKIGSTHFTRQIQKQAFLELKEIILEVLTAACKLNDSQKDAWSKLVDIVYSIVFNAMDAQKTHAK